MILPLPPSSRAKWAAIVSPSRRDAPIVFASLAAFTRTHTQNDKVIGLILFIYCRLRIYHMLGCLILLLFHIFRMFHYMRTFSRSWRWYFNDFERCCRRKQYVVATAASRISPRYRYRVKAQFHYSGTEQYMLRFLIFYYISDMIFSQQWNGLHFTPIPGECLFWLLDWLSCLFIDFIFQINDARGLLYDDFLRWFITFSLWYVSFSTRVTLRKILAFTTKYSHSAL